MTLLDTSADPPGNSAFNGGFHTATAAPAGAGSRTRDLAVITHELRNSLAVLRNAAHLLKQPLAADRVESARALIERHIGQISLHLQEMSETAHSGEHRYGLRFRHVDLRLIVRFALDDIAPDLARRGHRLAVNLPLEPVFVQADTTRLEQVFCNLLTNAAKYTPAGGHVSLTMDLLEGEARVRIRDSGIGIAPAILPHIFGLFVQVDHDAVCAEGGRGIGLAVVRELVELHGGSVRAVSAGLGFGSEFTVRLPMSSLARPGNPRVCSVTHRPAKGAPVV